VLVLVFDGGAETLDDVCGGVSTACCERFGEGRGGIATGGVEVEGGPEGVDLALCGPLGAGTSRRFDETDDGGFLRDGVVGTACEHGSKLTRGGVDSIETCGFFERGAGKDSVAGVGMEQTDSNEERRGLTRFEAFGDGAKNGCGSGAISETLAPSGELLPKFGVVANPQ
jgi:hypothetical protein